MNSLKKYTRDISVSFKNFRYVGEFQVVDDVLKSWAYTSWHQVCGKYPAVDSRKVTRLFFCAEYAAVANESGWS